MVFDLYDVRALLANGFRMLQYGVTTIFARDLGGYTALVRISRQAMPYTKQLVVVDLGGRRAWLIENAAFNGVEQCIEALTEVERAVVTDGWRFLRDEDLLTESDSDAVLKHLAEAAPF